MSLHRRDAKRDAILATFKDVVVNVLYYDRKEDEELRPGDIERALASGVVTVEELIAPLRDEPIKATTERTP